MEEEGRVYGVEMNLEDETKAKLQCKWYKARFQ
jgi:hypothetical protein